MKYPTKIKYNKKANLKIKNNQNMIQPTMIDKRFITSIFDSKPSNYSLRDGRVNCSSIEKTAIVFDAYGNKIVLKENSTTFNADNNGPSLTFKDGMKKFNKRNKH